MADRSKGWPLTRELNTQERHQLLKALVLRRLTESSPIEYTRLVSAFCADTCAAAPLIWGYFFEHDERYAQKLIDLLDGTGLLRQRAMGPDPSRADYNLIGVTAGPRTASFMAGLPATVSAVLRYLPISNLLEFMATVLADEDLKGES